MAIVIPLHIVDRVTALLYFCLLNYQQIHHFIGSSPDYKAAAPHFRLDFCFYLGKHVKFRVLSVLKVRWHEKTMLPRVSGDSD